MSPSHSSHYRILVIEDNSGDVLLLGEAFRATSLSCKVVNIADGEKALEYIAEVAQLPAEKPDVVILDMHLPKFDAPTILEAMRSVPYLSQIPVIVASSAVSNQDREAVRPYKVVHHIEKPTDLDEFMALGRMVRDLLYQSQPKWEKMREDDNR